MVDPAHARIGSQELVGQLRHREVIHAVEYSAVPGERQAAPGNAKPEMRVLRCEDLAEALDPPQCAL
jgi:hypothetical protein